jgi:hypothetical protein
MHIGFHEADTRGVAPFVGATKQLGASCFAYHGVPYSAAVDDCFHALKWGFKRDQSRSASINHVYSLREFLRQLRTLHPLLLRCDTY